MEQEFKAPRRNRLDLNTPAELAIYNAMQEVEKAGASARLTEAITLLNQARNAVADHVDGVTSPLPSAEQQGWISVKDGLPEKNKDVLLFGENNRVDYIIQGYFNREFKWELGDGFPLETVTHWMPLPFPHQSSDTNNK